MAIVLAAIILYNPQADVVTNVDTYKQNVDGLLVIDNSDKPHRVADQLKLKYPDLIYIKNKENLGIAAALNQAANVAIDKGFQWLLTMDQDSAFASGSTEILINSIKENHDTVAIYTPVHVNKDTIVKDTVNPYKVVKKTMTSGNLLNLEAYKVCGAFEEKLFIDYVDHDYNLRLLTLNFKIIRVNHALLIHNLGDISSWKWGFISMKATNHNALRRYYITRNRLYVISRYIGRFPGFCLKEIKHFFLDCFRILLFEKNKQAKFKSVLYGIFDWARSKYGKAK